MISACMALWIKDDACCEENMITENNYQTYLRRMTESYDNTTKSLIPFYTTQAVKSLDRPHILDVGIGSGVVGKGLRAMIPDAEIYGIDMVQDNIDHAPAGIYDHLITGRFEEYAGIPEGFDAIIFSSVLHEIGSYADMGRFTDVPVRDALLHAKALLRTGGTAVVREGLAENDARAEEPVIASLLREEDVLALERFYTERPLSEKEDAEEQPELRRRPQKLPGNGAYDCLVPRDILREFLCTWTWGPKSWNREIQERFCYFSAKKWEDLLAECGFEVITSIQSSEEYLKYFKKIIRGYETDSPLVGVFVGKKR